MAATQISKEDMEKTASDAQALGEDLMGKLQNLMVMLEPMQQDLQGSAGTTFQQVKTDIGHEVTNINRQLDDIAEGIRSTGRDMDASDIDSDNSLRQAAADVSGTTASNQLSVGQ